MLGILTEIRDLPAINPNLKGSSNKKRRRVGALSMTKFFILAFFLFRVFFLEEVAFFLE